jgi:hypothetical protein
MSPSVFKPDRCCGEYCDHQYKLVRINPETNEIDGEIRFTSGILSRMNVTCDEWKDNK